MKKNDLRILLLILSVLLLIGNIAFTEVDLGFYLRIIGNVFVILALINVIKKEYEKV